MAPAAMLLALQLALMARLAAGNCVGTPRAFLRQRVEGAARMTALAPAGVLEIDAREWLADARERPLEFSWCTEWRSDMETRAPTEAPQELAPAPAPTQPPSWGCPNRELHEVACGYQGISREECWARGCCYDPTHVANRCYPVANNNQRGRRVLQDDSGLPPRCLSRGLSALRTDEPRLVLPGVVYSGRVRIRMTVRDNCDDFIDLTRSFEVDTTMHDQCPSYEASPPGSIGSCYCADKHMNDFECPTCSVMLNLCPEGYVHDLRTDRCVYDSVTCIDEEQVIASRDPDLLHRNVIDGLSPIFPNECVDNTAAPTISPTREPTRSPTLRPPTTSPSRAPSQKPTTAPTAEPTSSPVARECVIFPELGGFTKNRLRCELPFTFRRNGHDDVVFDYPPLVSEAEPWDIDRFGLDRADPLLRWCMPEGKSEESIYNYHSSKRREYWGVARCTYPDMYPSEAPTRAPSPSSPPTEPDTTAPTRLPTVGPSESGGPLPTPRPTERPTPRPTPRPTSRPTRRFGCFVPAGGQGWVTTEAECELPFTYEPLSGPARVWEFPPLISDAEPHGLAELGLDPTTSTARWCPVAGETRYSPSDSFVHKLWGVAQCTEDFLLPSQSPTPRPSLAPSARPTVGPTEGDLDAECRIPSGNPGWAQDSPCQLPFEYHRDNIHLSFEYPPLVEEAEPWGLSRLDDFDQSDRTIRWCPKQGTERYDFRDDKVHKEWGVVECANSHLLPSSGPSRAPTRRPTPAPTHFPSQRPAEVPPRFAGCHLAQGNAGWETEYQECQLPFQYRKGRTRVTFDYPPTLLEATPWGVDQLGLQDADRSVRWCPVAGLTKYDHGQKGDRKRWGVVTCTELDLLPTFAPSVSPTRFPTTSHGCYIPEDAPGYIRERTDCQIPFEYNDDDNNDKRIFDYPPLLTEAKPHGLANLGINMYDPEARWCPPVGTTRYDTGHKKLRWQWGTAECHEHAVVPSAKPTERYAGRPNPGGLARPAIGCVSRCRVGFDFDEASGKCVPLAAPACAEQHYYNPDTCSVRRCGVRNDEPLQIALEATFEGAKGQVTLHLVSNVHWEDVNASRVAWTEVPPGKVLTFQERRVAPTTRVSDVYTLEPPLLLPGQTFRATAEMVDQCGRRAALAQPTELQVPNTPPVIDLHAVVSVNGQVARTLEPQEESETLTVYRARTPGPVLSEPAILVLDASQSRDPDGYPLNWFRWTDTEGNVLVDGQNAHYIELRFTEFDDRTLILRVDDKHGAYVEHLVQVLISPNAPPRANAGASSTDLELGAFSRAWLDASWSSDDDGELAFAWTLLSARAENAGSSGLPQATATYLAEQGVPGFFGDDMPAPQIADAGAMRTAVTGFRPGVYIFQLVVTDVQGLTDSTSVEIRVEQRFDAIDSLRFLEPQASTVWSKGAAHQVQLAPVLGLASSGLDLTLELRDDSGRAIWSRTMPANVLDGSAPTSIELLVPAGLATPALYVLEGRLSLQGTGEGAGSIPLPFTALSAPFSVRDRYLFEVGPWQPCELICPQPTKVAVGSSQRQVRCIDAVNGAQVSLARCAHELGAAQPADSRVCLGSCDAFFFTLSLGPWSSCDTLGCGRNAMVSQTRTIECTDTATGAPVDLDLCAPLFEDAPVPVMASRACPKRACAEMFELVSFREYEPTEDCMCRSPDEGFALQASEVCVDAATRAIMPFERCAATSTQPPVATTGACTPADRCRHVVWVVSPWSQCSKVCGPGALMSRSVRCFDMLLRSSVPNAYCANIGPAPQSTRQCNHHVPCVTHSWWVSPWSACSGTCDCDKRQCGTRTRDVQCLAVSRETGSRSLSTSIAPCIALGVPQPASVEACGDRPAECDANQVTAPGCDRDRFGRCCDDGERPNACGECGGRAAAVFDGNGACCESGVLDATHACCPDGVLDACGVCGGTGATCAQLVRYRFARSPDELALLQVGSGGILEYLLTEEAARAMDQPAANLNLRSVASNGARRLQDGSEVQATSTWAVKAGDAGWLQALQAAAGAPSSPLELAGRDGVCGNGVCEVGELCSSGASDCCAGDCPLSRQACPVDSNGVVCSGHGMCLGAAGQCSCHSEQGYIGDDCSECAPGWALTDSTTGGAQVCAPARPSQAPTLFPTQTPEPTRGPTLAGETIPPSSSPSAAPSAQGPPLVVTITPTTSPSAPPLLGETPAPTTTPTAAEEGGWEEWWPVLIAVLLVLLVLIGTVALCLHWRERRRLADRKKVFITQGLPDKLGPGRSGPATQVVPGQAVQESALSVYQGGPKHPWDVMPDPPEESESCLQPRSARGAGAPNVHLEGWLKMGLEGELRGGKRWDTLYFVLYKAARMLTYYMGVAPTSQYNVYTGELGSIYLESLLYVRITSREQHRDCVFEIGLQSTHGRAPTRHLFMCESASVCNDWVVALTHYIKPQPDSASPASPRRGKRSRPKPLAALTMYSAQTAPAPMPPAPQR